MDNANKYETMFIIKPDLSNERKETLFKEIALVVTKSNGKVINQQLWSDKKKLTFNIKKYQEAIYYLLQFDVVPAEIVKLRQLWKLNEDILRFQILKIAEK